MPSSLMVDVVSEEPEKTRLEDEPEAENDDKFIVPTSFPLFYEAAKLRIINPVPENNGSGVEGFPLFMALPMEIRLEIWQLALPGRRTLEVYGSFEGYAPNLCNREAFDMPLAAACRESRAFIKDYGYKPLWPHLLKARTSEPFRGPWFCSGVDVIRNLESDIERLFRMCPPAQFLFGSILEKWP
ncbi:hypothetical protein F5Y08DRAFT_269913 [Xylaria arbuscula]|nr:hypothetical protein F5Y08DRAFT_269913 [Xylaria arbuscula]